MSGDNRDSNATIYDATLAVDGDAVRRARRTPSATCRASPAPNTSTASPATQLQSTPMWTRRPHSIPRAFGVALLGALVLATIPAAADGDADLRARYPMSAPSSTTYAGIEIDRISAAQH